MSFGHLRDIGSRQIEILFLHALFAQLSLRQKLGVAAEQNVRSAPRHVRRDRDRAVPPRLRDDLRLARVVLRVQYVVFDPFPL